MKKKQPNPLLWAIVLTLILSVGKELLHMYAVTHTLYFGEDNLPMLLGNATGNFLFAFLPVALVVWAVQSFIGLFTRGKKPPAQYL